MRTAPNSFMATTLTKAEKRGQKFPMIRELATIAPGSFESHSGGTKEKNRGVERSASGRHSIRRWLTATGMEPAAESERPQGVNLTPRDASGSHLQPHESNLSFRA